MKEFQEAEKEEEKEITIDIYVRQTQNRKRDIANKKHSWVESLNSERCASLASF